MSDHYEHICSILKIPHQITQTGMAFFKTTEPPKMFDLEKMDDSFFKAHFKQYEEQGYRIVAIQPLLEAFESKTKSQNIVGNMIYNLHTNIMFVWQRECKYLSY